MTVSHAGSPTPDAAEVEHRREPAVADQEVPGGDVAVEPDRRALPRRAHGVREIRSHVRRAGISSASASIAGERLVLVGGQRPASEEVVRPAAAAVASIAAERAGSWPAPSANASGRRSGGRGRLAVEPAVHRPGVRDSAASGTPAASGAGIASGSWGRARAASAAPCRPAGRTRARWAAARSARRRAGRCGCPIRRARPSRWGDAPTGGTGCRSAGVPRRPL